MWRRVDIVWTDISEKHIASTRSSETSVYTIHGATSQKTAFYIDEIISYLICLCEVLISLLIVEICDNDNERDDDQDTGDNDSVLILKSPVFFRVYTNHKQQMHDI
jgi:hypothetical protein